jgi:glucosamine-6-phosphate deaminase
MLMPSSEDATNELRVKTVKYFKSIEKVQDEVESKYGEVASIRMGLKRASAA